MEKTSYLLAGSGILATKRRIFGRKVIRGGGNALPLERIVEPYHGEHFDILHARNGATDAEL